MRHNRDREAGGSPRLAVQYAVPRAGLPARVTIERWVQAALRRTATLTVRFVGRAEGRALNRRYRARDYATNVLTFVYQDEPLTGDIVLCAPVVAREARGQSKPLAWHYAHLVVHGVLHLQGHDHMNRRDAGIMERLETDVLAGFGVPDPYAVPARAA